MGYPDISFAGKAAKFAMSTLATAVIITASSAIAHGKEAVKSDKRNIVPPYAARDNNTVCTGCKSRNKPINIRDNRNLQDLSVSKEFKYYKQMDSLDLADPEQADTFLRFMDIRLAEKELNEEVLLVSHNKPVMKDPEKIDKPKRVDKKKAERISSLKERQKDRGKTIASKGPVERKGVDKEKEQARMARVMERRKAREQAKAEERRKAEEKANPGKQKAEELNLAEAEQKHKADEKAKTEQKKAEAQALEKKSKEKKQEHTSKDSGKKCPLEEKKKEEAARLARKQEEQKDESVQKPAVDILPDRSITYQIASDEEAAIINFDQAITQRFKSAGSYLDQGENGNNIVKDNQGREFLNVMAFWDVMVEPLNDGENRYYGSIQFPLGSRHPVIVNSIKSGDTLGMGCKANEVVVLKGFETEGVDYKHGLIDAYLAYSVVMPDGTVAFQEAVHQPSFSLINVETGCMPRDMFSRSDVDPERMGHDKTVHALPVKE